MPFFVFLTYASAYRSFWSVLPEMGCHCPGVRQCHDLPFSLPKVLRILCATSRALQTYHANPLARQLRSTHVQNCMSRIPLNTWNFFFQIAKGLRSEALVRHDAYVYAAFSSCCTSPHDASCLPTPHLPSILSCHILSHVSSLSSLRRALYTTTTAVALMHLRHQQAL